MFRVLNYVHYSSSIQSIVIFRGAVIVDCNVQFCYIHIFDATIVYYLVLCSLFSFTDLGSVHLPFLYSCVSFLGVLLLLRKLTFFICFQKE